MGLVTWDAILRVGVYVLGFILASIVDIVAIVVTPEPG